MSSKLARRDFLKTTSALAAGVALAGAGNRLAFAAEKVCVSSPAAAKFGWRIGVQQYTFRSYSFFEMLDIMVKLGIECAEGGFFLKLDSARPQLQTNEDLSSELRREVKQRMADRGLSMPTFYANLGAEEARDKKIFEFCKEMGTDTIVAEPPVATLDRIDKLCNEYAINLAIHNHPKSPQSPNWKPELVLEKCKNRSKRIGGCCDTGHWVRSGLDPVECLKKMEGHVLGFHLKDVIEAGKPEARDVPLGEGKANYAAVLAELKRQAYRGVTVIEYEHDSPELVADVAKCVAFVEKTVKAFPE